jgi:hypothetical protein
VVTPVQPPNTDWTQVNYIYNTTTVRIDETNISQQINNLVQTLNSITITNNYSQPLLLDQRNCGCLTSYTKGTVHPSLTGTGALAISGVVGFEVQIDAYPDDTKMLEGNPPYLWNMGWVTVNNVDGMVAEKRITRTGFLWFPEQIGVAASFNWWLPVGVTISVTELQRGT